MCWRAHVTTAVGAVLSSQACGADKGHRCKRPLVLRRPSSAARVGRRTSRQQLVRCCRHGPAGLTKAIGARYRWCCVAPLQQLDDRVVASWVFLCARLPRRLQGINQHLKTSLVMWDGRFEGRSWWRRQIVASGSRRGSMARLWWRRNVFAGARHDSSWCGGVVTGLRG